MLGDVEIIKITEYYNQQAEIKFLETRKYSIHDIAFLAQQLSMPLIDLSNYMCLYPMSIHRPQWIP